MNEDLSVGDQLREKAEEQETLGRSGDWLRDLARYIDHLEAHPSLSELQRRVEESWTLDTYHADFLASPVKHRDFAHALLHVQKAAGKLAAVVDAAEHGEGSTFPPEEVDRFVADLVVCALRMANTCPERQIDLPAAVEKRIAGNQKRAEDT